MSSTTTVHPPLGPHEQALAQYRTISPAALLALGLGLASPLVLVSPLLAPIPLLAIAAAVVSLRGIQASGGQSLGRVPAALGLCLATFFLGWGVSQRFSRELTLEGHARNFAEAWLTLVANGDLQQAHQLHAPPHGRIRSAEARREFYERNPGALTELNSFFSTPALQDFIAQGASVKFQFDSPAGGERGGTQDIVVLKYTFGASDNSTRPLWITVKRQIDEEHADWQIENVAAEPKSGS